MATHKEKWSAVRNLDLEKIRLKWLIDYKNSLRIWQFCKKKNAETYAMQLQHEYRQFLFLCAVNPGKVIVPWSNDLDEFWHMHLLHTEKYASDCDQIFGRVLKHTPLDPCHVASRPASHVENYRETKRLYAKTFGTGSGGSADFVRDTYDSYDPLMTFLVMDAVMDHHELQDNAATTYVTGVDVGSGSSFSSVHQPCEAPDPTPIYEAPDPGPAPDNDVHSDGGSYDGGSDGGDSGGASCGGDSGGGCGASCGGGCGGD